MTTDPAAPAPDWTTDADGRSNSSAEYLEIQDAIAALIRESASSLIGGHVRTVAGLILAQLAHVHGLGPARPVSAPSTDPAVPAPGVLAVERFRTAVGDRIGRDPSGPTVSDVVGLFPSAQFVHDVNSAGVPVRRLVVHGEWEVDPNPPPAHVEGRFLAKPHDGMNCVAAFASEGAESPTHPFEPVRYKGRIEEGCGHFTRINSHEGRLCSEPRSATIHPPVFTCCPDHEEVEDIQCCENCPDDLQLRIF